MNLFLKVNTDMLCVCKTDGTIQKANQKFENVLGHKAEELEGKNIFSMETFLLDKCGIMFPISTGIALLVLSFSNS